MPSASALAHLLTLGLALFSMQPSLVSSIPIAEEAQAAPSIASATLKERCDSPLEDSPWQITNLTLFYPAPVGKSNGTLSFTFHDNNAFLGLKTTCTGTVTPEGECTNGYGGYVGCKNGLVQFQLHEGSMLMLAKFYRNPCEEKPYDGHNAFGYNYTRWTKQASKAGKKLQQEKMVIPIRQLS